MTTTQKAPTTIKTIHQMDNRRHADAEIFGVHGYCTVRWAERAESSIYFDVYCQIDGDEVRIGRLLTQDDVVRRVNDANAKSFKGEQV